jgi:hypothetical protein
MTNKLEAQYIEFVRKLSRLELPISSRRAKGGDTILSHYVADARHLHQALLDSGYGK